MPLVYASEFNQLPPNRAGGEPGRSVGLGVLDVEHRLYIEELGVVRANRLLGIVIVGLIIVGFPGSADAFLTKNRQVDYCKYTSTADDGPIGMSAQTRTFAGSNACRYVDADTKYFKNRNFEGQVYTKWCAYTSDPSKRCNVDGDLPTPRPHHQSRSRANDWETGRWGSTGWWG